MSANVFSSKNPSEMIAEMADMIAMDLARKALLTAPAHSESLARYILSKMEGESSVIIQRAQEYVSRFIGTTK